MNDLESGKSEGKLFRSGRNWKLNACVNYVHDDWDLYAEGFFKAAEELIRTVVEKNGQDIDYLIYPIVFCFRHALELQLKASIRWGRLLLGKQSKGYPQGHKLTQDRKGIPLWMECRSIAETVWPDSPTNELDEIEVTLLELEKHDSDGQAFKYSVDTQGSRTKADLTHINIEAFYELAKKAYRLLDSIATGCEEMWRQQMEMWEQQIE